MPPNRAPLAPLAAGATEIAPPSLAELAGLLWAAHGDPHPDLKGVLLGCVAHVCQGRLPDSPLIRAGIDIAAAVTRHGEQEYAQGREPQYHNRQHFAEVLYSMSRLCALAMSGGELDEEGACIGLVCMLAHDYLHDGTLSGPDHNLEAASYDAIRDMLAGHGVDEATRALIRDIILATDPAFYSRNHEAYANRRGAGAGDARLITLRVLANESDLMASCLPRLGWQLGRALAQERAQRGVVERVSSGSATGRLAFLRFCRMSSEAAGSLGIIALRDLQIHAFARIAAILRCADLSADAGVSALESLDYEAAGDLYFRAVGDLLEESRR